MHELPKIMRPDAVNCTHVIGAGLQHASSSPRYLGGGQAVHLSIDYELADPDLMPACSRYLGSAARMKPSKQAVILTLAG